jgi:hypothetical protein
MDTLTRNPRQREKTTASLYRIRHVFSLEYLSCLQRCIDFSISGNILRVERQLLCDAILMKTSDQAPAITGVPSVDAPLVLEWPADSGHMEPSLSEPTANLLNDLHAEISECDMVLTTAGNYHMALRDLWQRYLSMFPDDAPLRNWYYTTSPPVAKQQIVNGLVQFGNLRARCRPQVAVGPKGLIDSLVHAGYTNGDSVPVSKTRGNVLLVKRGNPKHVATIWDLGRSDVRIITPNPEAEGGSFTLYARSVYDIARDDRNPPPGMTARSLFNLIFNNAGNDPQKWLTGRRIHHREIPWSVACGRADAGVFFYHLARHAVNTFPDLFDIIPLGGTPTDPRPIRGNHTEVLFAIRIRGDWTETQHLATEKLMELFQSEEFTRILDLHGLARP